MALGQVSDFYGPEAGFSDLTRQQSNQSISVGNAAAKMADPFMNERPKYQNALSKLVENPGSFESSPFYKFAYDQGLNALQRKGGVRSGNKMAQLMEYGQGMASKAYFPQAQLLGNLAMSGSNPGAGALAMTGGYNRSQDQRSMSAAQGAAGRGSFSGGSSTPWWMTPTTPAKLEQPMTGTYYADGSGSVYGGSGYGSNYGGGYMPSGGGFDYSYGDSYTPSYDYSDYGYSAYGDDYNDGYGGYDYSSDWGY